MIFQKKINFALLALLVAGNMRGIDGNVQVNNTGKPSWTKQKIHNLRERANDAYAFTCEKTRALYEKAKENKKIIAGIVTGVVVGYLGTEGILLSCGNPSLFRMPGELRAANQATQNAVNQFNIVNPKSKGRKQALVVANQTNQDLLNRIAGIQQQLDNANQDGQVAQQEIDRLNQQIESLQEDVDIANELCDINEQLYQELLQEKQARLVRVEKVQNVLGEPIANNQMVETISIDNLNDVNYVLLNEQIIHNILSQNTSDFDNKLYYNMYLKIASNSLLPDNAENALVLANSANNNIVPMVLNEQRINEFCAMLVSVIDSQNKTENALVLANSANKNSIPMVLTEQMYGALCELIASILNSQTNSDELNEGVSLSEEDSGSWELDLSSDDDDEHCNIF